MSWDQRAAVLLVSVPLIAGWILTELTHSLFPRKGRRP
jgi:hypothetical protein